LTVTHSTVEIPSTFENVVKVTQLQVFGITPVTRASYNASSHEIGCVRAMGMQLNVTEA